ncbi:XdhC family protein [Deltaproteobacteria bacterium OttesenSCG-928-M10]|nr:XdhC family protein [Deltaproteobacteria bacterium OttesenSCG-928-M10]
MNVWKYLNNRSSIKETALAVTLLKAPDAGSAGLMAALDEPGGEAAGPLTRAPFWAEDWAAALHQATAGYPPEEGRLVENAGRRYYISSLSYGRSALVLGGGHVGAALCRLLRFLDFAVTLMDDRPDFLKSPAENVEMVEASFSRLTGLFGAAPFDAVVIVTRGHAQDTACLRQVLGWPQPPPYLGMIGSRRRTAATMALLSDEGYDQKKLSRVHTPIGLDIGAQTPEEIAVSIAAEIIMVLKRGNISGSVD